MKKPTPFGKYFLLERINVGGMAEVFRAKAFGVEGFERLVAVKRILSNIAEDKEFIRMFIDEAKLSVQLNHANIAQIFDLGVVEGSYYIALEHVHGRDLRSIFDRCRHLGAAMPVAQACFIAMKVCEGLDYAHNKRDPSGRELSLVHRDVSPQNLLVSFEGEVKIIDFGIAKAAGKNVTPTGTQAGILKGKFGYMSPEQVNGVPVDRRSDVFSCGIVLYELLTGERLFVGESDFSTLEKVRNVEILPPSTYDRRIPDELERIVLKALAKSVDERYQNAIDLHDELQAFVYTAGEFYSRKDLAGWMKKTFSKEIEEETAKLESFRQLRPPVEPARAKSIPPPPPPPRAPSSPPVQLPSPASSSQQIPALAPPPTPPPPVRGRPEIGQPEVHAASALSVAAASEAPGAARELAVRRPDSSGDGWGDEELETRVYDNPNEVRSGRVGKALPLPPPAAADAASELNAGATVPDLSSLVSTAKGWDAAARDAAATHGTSTLNGVGGLGALVGANGAAGRIAQGSHAMRSTDSGAVPVAVPVAVQSTPREAPRVLESGPRALAAKQAPAMAAPTAVPALAVRPVAERFDPMSTFGQGVTQRSQGKRGILLIAIGGAAIAAAAVVAVVWMTGKPAPVNRTAAPPPPAVVDQNTGFDLYVTPAGIARWKLNGEVRTDRLPSSIRGVAPGTHTVQIDAPPGFVGQNKQVQVAAGKAHRVDIALDPLPGIHGVFESEPTGAAVTLIVDGKNEPLGASPAKVPLDPRHSYRVLFEKAGYVSSNQPIVFTGVLEERTVVKLDKIGALTPPKAAPKEEPKATPKEEPKATPKEEPKAAPRPEPKAKAPKVVREPPPKAEPAGEGIVALGSKPVCEIFVDGASTGLYTPQPNLKLPAGKRKIMLVNNEYGIKDSFVVDVKADATAKLIKDYSDRLPEL